MFNDMIFECLQKDFCYGARNGGNHGYTLVWFVNLVLEGDVILVKDNVQ
jgi:hypothetical protein